MIRLRTVILHIMGGKIISDGVEASICGAIFYERQNYNAPICHFH